VKRILVEHNRYFDSVFLMRISSELEGLEGISQAVVAMGTPLNIENLEKTGFELAEAIQPADLVLAIEADDESAIHAAETALTALLAGGTGDAERPSERRPTSLDEALSQDPDANLALISVPGIHAAREARMALRRGLHVMLFSDNVSIEDEIALKDEAIRRGLLLMGPDCGTAILHRAPLGFANACRAGTIGIVGASGTGIQEISSLVHQWGGGISHAIGTGGRDLSLAVDGRMTRFGIASLGHDTSTDVIVVVSKTPAPAVADKVLRALEESGTPSVVHFIGGSAEVLSQHMETTETLADAARAALVKAGIPVGSGTAPVRPLDIAVSGALLGLFCGGTLCQEVWNLLTRAGLDVCSNVAGNKEKKVHAEEAVSGHVVWDLGDDAFTVGKPHPMIEPSLRDARVAEAGADPSVGLVIADCVIGYGAHADPAGSLADAARAAIEHAHAQGRQIALVASVTGTDDDPQKLSKQQRILRDAGVIVASSNAEAARIAIHLIKGGAS
jgi:FdrA protein